MGVGKNKTKTKKETRTRTPFFIQTNGKRQRRDYTGCFIAKFGSTSLLPVFYLLVRIQSHDLTRELGRKILQWAQTENEMAV